MKISARNILKGKIKTIIPGAINAEVIVELSGGAEIVSVITKESVASLGLAAAGGGEIVRFHPAWKVTPAGSGAGGNFAGGWNEFSRGGSPYHHSATRPAGRGRAAG